MTEIKGFENPQYRWLSNFYPIRMKMADGLTYGSTEHVYQAMKSNSLEDRAKVAASKTPGQAKRLGRRLKMREDWDQIKREIMKQILRVKFTHPILRQKLLDTGDAYLEETNHWGDTYWGVCHDVGLNQLGEILMEIREEIRQ